MVTPIVFIGDSITEAWGCHRAETFARYGLIARGASGQTARWVAMRFRRDLEETGARGVHLLCGVNDIGRNEGFFVPVEEIGATLAAMLDEARAMGVEAWVGSIMPAACIPWNPEVQDTPAMIAAVNAWLRTHAAEHGARFVDYHSVLADASGGLRPEYGTDGLHLSAAGFAAIEPLMLTALGRIQPEPSPAIPRRGTGPQRGRRPEDRRRGPWSWLSSCCSSCCGSPDPAEPSSLAARRDALIAGELTPPTDTWHAPGTALSAVIRRDEIGDGTDRVPPAGHRSGPGAARGPISC